MAQKAPGKYHREGMTLAELFHMFPDGYDGGAVVRGPAVA